MFKKVLFLLIITFLSLRANAQSYCDFSNCLFWQPQSATVLGDTVNYATNQWSIDEWENIDCNFPAAQCENLTLEVYYPPLPQGEKRPLLFLVHGGGFIGGSRADFRAQAINIAKLGFVTATIDYRLCKRNNCLLLNVNPALLCNLNWGSDFAQSSYVATLDANNALKFLKQNSEQYHIDTNNIVVGGHSAGAFTVLQMAFLDQDEATTLGSGLAGTWGNLNQQQGIKGVVALSPSMHDTSFIDADENIPAFIVHGTCDPVLCYGTDGAFHCNTYPDVYGGADIATRIANLDHNYYLYTGQDMGHDIGPLAANWLIEMLYFIRKNALCSEPIQKHSVVDLNPESSECAVLEGNQVQGPHTRLNPVDLPQTNVFGNFPAPCALTSVDENKAEEISLYPNPASNYFTLNIPVAYNKSTLQIINVQGQLVYSQTIPSGIQNIQLDNMPNGLYMVTIQADGKQVYANKIVVEK